MKIIFTIAIAAILVLSFKTSYSKNFLTNPPDSLKIKKTESPVPQSFKFYKAKDMLASINTLMFDVPEKSTVSMKIYDYDNKFVMELFNEEFDAGTYSFNPSYLHYETSGVYKIVMTAGKFSDSRKIIIVK